MTGYARGLFIVYRLNVLLLLRFAHFNKTLTFNILNYFIYILYLYQQNETNLFIMKNWEKLLLRITLTLVFTVMAWGLIDIFLIK